MLTDKNLPFVEAEGEAAFYGPKIDIQAKNVYGKEDTMVTVQLDCAIAENFDMYYAEGTRSKNGNEVQDFKGGSFKAATKAKCPIVPVALIDSFKPFDTNTISPVTVQVHFLEPLLYEDYKDMKTSEIAHIVKNRIKKAIERNEKKYG